MKRSLLLYLLILSPALFLSANAQQRLTATKAADSAQSIRSSTRKLYTKTNPTKQELEQSIELLKAAVQFVDRDSIKELGEGSLYLKFRKSDLTRDLIYAYALNHQYEDALATFNTHFGEGTSFFILPMEHDSTFIPIRSDPRFIAAINKYKTRLALWNGTALKTPYKAQLSDAEKIAGLSLFWSQARANFVYFDKLPADWNQTYLDFIPQVQAAKTTLEYYRVLQKFCAQLHDGHSNVFLPKELSMEVNARPPVKTDLIEGRVFITAVRNDSLKKEGLLPGLEIIKIDNIPVKTYADTYVKPYQGAATPQDMEQRAFNYYLLAGAANKPVLLELRDKQGHTLIKSIPRSGYAKLKPVPAMEFKEIDHIGYLNINNFEDEKIIKQFDSLYSQIAATKGLIIDVRSNSGGNSYIGQEILSRLTDKPFDLFAYKYARYDSKGSEPFWSNQPLAKAYPNKTIYYNKPVVMLVSTVTYSAAEDFVVAFDYMKRGKLIGQTTGGSTGQPIGFSLPGGGTARICGKRETYPDGKEFVDIGIKPDITIDKTVDDLYKGKDSVLRKALEMLN
jgi:C-terminal processing protease CtpA/Prc